jgi:molybdate transport system substrate-binding protein
MKKLNWLCITCLMLAGLLATGCAPQQTAPPQGTPQPTAIQQVKLTVFAAASLTESFNAIAKAYSADHPGISIIYNFAGSQQLAQQIAQGAEAEVFASAGQSPMQAVIKTGRIQTSEVKPFATNQLVVILPKDNPAKVASLLDLARPGLKIILAAQNVPAGEYAQQFLKNAGRDETLGTDYASNVSKNVVSFEDNVKNVVSKIQLGEADAGIVYQTDAISAKGQVQQLPIPAKLNVLAEYPLAVLQDAHQPEAARDFIRFILSPDGQEILASYGFGKIQSNPG